MMLIADDAALKDLATRSDEWCVSAFLPAHRPGLEQGGDAVRMKNLLREAEKELVSLGVRAPEAAQLIATADTDELRDRTSPAFHQAGLAVYVAPGLHRTYRLLDGAPELVTVGRRFHLKPLLPDVAHDRSFFALKITRGSAELFRGGPDELVPIDVPGMPQSLDDAIQYDDRERKLLSHSASRRGRGSVVAAFHGQGDRGDHLPEDLLRYLRMVDAEVSTVLAGEPLVLAGSGDVVAAYRQISGCATLAEPTVAGNPESLSQSELHERALEIVEGALVQAGNDSAERFHQLNGTGRASGDPAVAVRAAVAGRVDVAFVAADAHRWGHLDAAGEPDVHDDRLPGDEDLLDRIAVETWLHGGTVHVLGEEAVPGDGPVAAVFRY
jgi:hypothetical protein